MDLLMQFYNNEFDDCGGPYDLTSSHTISCWEARPTTCDEEAVITYLVASPGRYYNKTLLHIGIGNGSLFASTGANLDAYTGITISCPELESFKDRFADKKNARAILANKHDERLFDLIGYSFDIIVDVNLKSFACCEKHFRSTMRYFGNCLTRGGMLITAERGLNFGWAGNIAVAHTPGADTNPAASVNRILGPDGFVRLGADLDLAVETVSVPPNERCTAETLWIFRKV